MNALRLCLVFILFGFSGCSIVHDVRVKKSDFGLLGVKREGGMGVAESKMPERLSGEVVVQRDNKLCVSGTESFSAPVATEKIEIDSELSICEFVKLMLSVSSVSYALATRNLSTEFLDVKISGEFSKDDAISICSEIMSSRGLSVRVVSHVAYISEVGKASSGTSTYDYVSVRKMKYMSPARFRDIQSNTGVSISVYSRYVIVFGSKDVVTKYMNVLDIMDANEFAGWCFFVVDVRTSAKDVCEKVVLSLSDVSIMYHVIPVSSRCIFASCANVDYVDTIRSIIGFVDVAQTDKGVKVIRLKYRDVSDFVSFSQSFLSDYKFSVDVQNNCIYVYDGETAQYEIVKSAVDRFDVAPMQFLLQVIIIDVNNSDAFNLSSGVNFSDGKYSFSSLPGTGGMVAGILSGDVNAYVHFLETNFKAKVVQRPILCTYAGRESEIKIGQSVPVLTSKQSTTGTGVIQGVEYRDVGIIVRITPVATLSGNVLSVYVENSQVQGSGVEGNPLFGRDSTVTKYCIDDDKVCVISGVKTSNNNVSVNGIPFLSRVPVFSWLLGGLKSKKEKREMMILVKATVMKSSDISMYSKKIMRMMSNN